MRTPPRIWPRGLLGSRSSMSVHNAFATTSYPPLPRRQRSFRRGRSGWPAPIVANRSSARRSFFRTQSPLQEIGKSILMIPVFLTNITAERVRTAMQSVRTRDLKEWAKNTFGDSAITKRRAAVRYAGIICRLARKRAPTPSGCHDA